MVKALFINGSPRKNGNTAQLLKRAMDGAREAGAEVELVNLYDRNLNYKGCMSCFACKLKGGKKGVCSFKDDLQPILQKAAMPPRSARLTRPRYAKRNSPSTSKKPTNWASDWLRNVRKYSIKIYNSITCGLI